MEYIISKANVVLDSSEQRSPAVLRADSQTQIELRPSHSHTYDLQTAESDDNHVNTERKQQQQQQQLCAAYSCFLKLQSSL